MPGENKYKKQLFLNIKKKLKFNKEQKKNIQNKYFTIKKLIKLMLNKIKLKKNYTKLEAPRLPPI